MPLGFYPPHPGGMTENSPTFQRWGREFRGAQVPKGRLKPCAIRQPSLRDLSGCGRWFPTLKRWAILEFPSGTKAWTGFLGILGNQILAAFDKNVRAPFFDGISARKIQDARSVHRRRRWRSCRTGLGTRSPGLTPFCARHTSPMISPHPGGVVAASGSIRPILRPLRVMTMDSPCSRWSKTARVS